MCVRVCVRACVCACVRACTRSYNDSFSYNDYIIGCKFDGGLSSPQNHNLDQLGQDIWNVHTLMDRTAVELARVRAG